MERSDWVVSSDSHVLRRVSHLTSFVSHVLQLDQLVMTSDLYVGILVFAVYRKLIEALRKM